MNIPFYSNGIGHNICTDKRIKDPAEIIILQVTLTMYVIQLAQWCTYSFRLEDFILMQSIKDAAHAFRHDLKEANLFQYT